MTFGYQTRGTLPRYDYQVPNVLRNKTVFRFLSGSGILKWARKLGAEMFLVGIKSIPLRGTRPRVTYNLCPHHLPGPSQDILLVPDRRSPSQSCIVDLFSGRTYCHYWYFLPHSWGAQITVSAHTGPFILVGFAFPDQPLPGSSENLEASDLLLIDAWTRTRIILAMGKAYLRFLM